MYVIVYRSTAVDDVAEEIFYCLEIKKIAKDRRHQSDNGNTERPADARITVKPVVWKPAGFLDAHFMILLVFGIHAFEPT